MYIIYVCYVNRIIVSLRYPSSVINQSSHVTASLESISKRTVPSMTFPTAIRIDIANEIATVTARLGYNGINDKSLGCLSNVSYYDYLYNIVKSRSNSTNVRRYESTMTNVRIDGTLFR